MSGGLRGDFVRGLTALVVGLVLVVMGSSQVQAAGFGDPFRVSSPAIDENGASQGQVVADDSGNFTYAWFQRESENVTALETQVGSSDGTKGPVNVIATADGSGSVFDYFDGLAMSVGPNGTVHLVWNRTTNTCSPVCVPQPRIQYVSLDSVGASLDPPVNVDTLPSGRYAVGPKVATTGTGRTGIIWGIFDGVDDVNINMAIALGDGNPLAPFTLNTDDWDGVQYMDIAGSENGNLFPTWSGYVDSAPGIEAHGLMVLGDGSISPERTLIASPSSLNALEARIDSTGKGSVFSLDQQESQVIVFRQMSPTGDLIGSATEAVSGDATDASIGSPFTAIADDGTITVAYNQPLIVDPNPVIWTRTILPSGSLGPENQFVPADPDLGFYEPSVAVGPDGSGVLTWREEPLTPPDNDNQPVTPGTYAYAEDAAFSADGNGVALWSEELVAEDFENEFYSAIFDASPPEAELWIPPVVTTEQEVVLAALASDNSELSYVWKVNGETLAATGPVIRHTFASAGGSNVEVTVTDAHSNETAVSGNLMVNLPPVPPQPPIPPDTLINAKPAKSTKSKSATFKFLSSLTGSKFECRLDKAGWSSGKSPKKPKKLKPGKHTFRLRAIKGDLIDKTPASYSWTVKKPMKRNSPGPTVRPR